MRQLIISTFVLITLTQACGGAAPAAKPGVHRHIEESTASKDSDREPASTGPDCSDGTCFKCGQALCLTGFFCDASAAPETCQWLPRCGKGAGCTCIQQTLGARCTCYERDGGLYVKCPG
jgi:hypothetical protein